MNSSSESQSKLIRYLTELEVGSRTRTSSELVNVFKFATFKTVFGSSSPIFGYKTSFSPFSRPRKFGTIFFGTFDRSNSAKAMEL
jgi:hypothetical protein